MTNRAKQYPSHSEKLKALSDGNFAPVVATVPDTDLAYAYGKSKVVTVTPTVTLVQYTSGDAVGGLLTISDAVRVAGASGIIQAVTLSDKGKQSTATDVIFFATNIPGTTVSDNNELDIHDSDLVNIIGHVSIATTDYAAFKASSVATKSGIGLPFEAASGNTAIYAVLVARGTPTYTSASDLKLFVRILQD